MKAENIKRAIAMTKMEKTEKSKRTSENEGVKGIVSVLFHSKVQVHVFHLQTQSYAEHMALNGFYTEIEDLIDGLVESYQGKYGIIESYESYPIEKYVSKAKLITYFEWMCEEVEEYRTSVTDSYLQNQIDTIIELIESTKYKIKFLS